MEVVTEEEMQSLNSTGENVVLENVVAEMEVVAQEEMQPLNDERKALSKVDNKEQNELDKCLEALSNLHECREAQFKLRYEVTRKLKEEKNRHIEALHRMVEKTI